MSGLFGNMGKFANTNPAEIIYKMALMQHSTMHGLSEEDFKENQFKALKEEKVISFDGTYQAFVEAHADAKLPISLQKTFSPAHIKWLKQNGLGFLLWEELDTF